jgi:hypothetical protein
MHRTKKCRTKRSSPEVVRFAICMLSLQASPKPTIFARSGCKADLYKAIGLDHDC